MHGRTVTFLLQPAQYPDLNTLDLCAWWSLETAVNELPYNPDWSNRNNRPSEMFLDLNDFVLRSWRSWNISAMLQKLQSTLFQNYWSVLSSSGRNDYDCRSAPPNPTNIELYEHLQHARLNPLWLEAKQM